MKKFSTEVGERLKEIRGDLTQQEFADIFKVKQNYISRYETGRIPNPKLLLKIAEYGGVTVDWILTGNSEKKTQDMVKESTPPYGKDETDNEIYELLKKLKPKDKKTILMMLQESGIQY
ncbi:MAG: helix-turn-helix transcriptional regulator [Nitrospinae bacterium]|nr:helix-turn-helix transcriptional regulator [Nitrospinota bacterium]